MKISNSFNSIASSLRPSKLYSLQEFSFFEMNIALNHSFWMRPSFRINVSTILQSLRCESSTRPPFECVTSFRPPFWVRNFVPSTLIFRVRNFVPSTLNFRVRNFVPSNFNFECKPSIQTLSVNLRFIHHFFQGRPSGLSNHEIRVPVISPTPYIRIFQKNINQRKIIHSLWKRYKRDWDKSSSNTASLKTYLQKTH